VKIAVVAPYFPPDITGSAIFASDLVRGMSESGHQIRVFTTSETGIRGSVPEIQVTEVPSFRLSLGAISYSYRIPFITLRLGFVKFFRELKRFNPNVVHVHGHLFDICLSAILFAKILKVPTVVTIHSPFVHVSRPIDGLLALLDTLVIAPILRLADLLVNVDRQTKKYLQMRHPKLNRIEIPVSAPLGKVLQGDRELVYAKHPQISRHKKTILSLGHVIPMRNRKALIEALPTILKTLPESQIVIVGSLYDETVQQFVRERGLEDGVIFTGAVPSSEIPDFLDLADVECHDLQGIGLGLTSLEAMQARVPTVFWIAEDNWEGVNFDTLGLARLVTNEPNEIALEILRLLCEAEHRDNVVESQDFLLENFLSFERIIEKYESLFEALVPSNR